MFSMLGTESNVVDSIVKFLQDILMELDLGTLLFIFGGIMLGIILISCVRLIWCYEDRAMRAMKRINKYLKNNPKINDDNLVDFHNKMKKLPRRIRDRWQLFMLEREGSPSRYMTVEYCVKRPLYNSAITMNQKQITYTAIILAVFSLIFSLSSITTDIASNYTTASTLLLSLIIPAIILIIASIYCMGLHIKYTSVNHDFYDMFTTFVRNIDKATNTMPDYVDYELLFTKKEIDKGIPVLREYLEKRAMEEQRLLEKAKKEEVNHSPYDFSSLGVNGAQLIERAVNESEKFLINKIQTQNEITDLEKQLQKSDANVEEIQRDANRKLQAIKENLERLDKAMSETTNRVEINYNRRQAEAEMDKKLLLEKDLESMLNKEKVASDALKVEIQKRKETIEENKKAVEEALKSEYDTFATKVYDELNEKITRDNSEQLHEMEMTIARLKAKVKEFTRDIEKKDSIIEARNLELDNVRQQISKQKGKGKSKKDFGQEYIKAQDNVPEGTINAVQVDYNDAQAPEQQYTETVAGEQQGYADVQNAESQYDTNANIDNQQPYDYAQTGANVDYSQQPQDYNYDNNIPPENYNYDYQNYQYDENGQPVDYGTQGGENVDNAAQYENNVYYDENGQPINYDVNAQPVDTQYSEYGEQPADNGYYGDYNTDNQGYGDTGFTESGTETTDDTTNGDNAGALGGDDAQMIPSTEQPVQEETSTEQPETKDEQADLDLFSNNAEPVNEPTEISFAPTDEQQAADISFDETQTQVKNAENTVSFVEEEKPATEQQAALIPEKVENVEGEEKQPVAEKSVEPEQKDDKSKAEDKAESDKETTEKANTEETLKPAKKAKVKKLTDEVPSSKEEKVDTKTDKEKTEKETDKKKETDKEDKSADKSEEKDNKKYVENDDLVALQKQIEEENARLKKQQEELRAQIDKTLASMEKAENATKAERTRNIKKIKDMISKLKVQAEEAKARGQSKASINKINKSAAELLKVLADYQSKK